MDQLPLDYKVTMFIGDYSDLQTLLETDKQKWQWMIDDIQKQISEQLTPLNEDNIINLLGFKKHNNNFYIESKDEMVQYILTEFNGSYCLGVDGHETKGYNCTFFAWNITTVNRVQNLLIDLNG